MSKQLTAGFNHVALVTADLDRLIAFYHEVFEAPVVVDLDEGHVRHAFIDMGGGSWIHAFMMPNNTHGIGSPEISHGDTLTTLSSTSSTKPRTTDRDGLTGLAYPPKVPPDLGK